MSQVTQILEAIQRGEAHAAEDLLPLVYHELRHLAAQRLSREQPGHTLQATALVHEAYLRLIGPDSAANQWDGRRHFFAAAAEAMRRILVESARRKQRIKHGGELSRAEVDVAEVVAPEIREDLVALDSALTRLAATDRVASDLVQLRYFGGLTGSEAAQALGLSTRTAERIWSYARAWLHREIQGGSSDTGESL
ncbi:MAG: RNA polymerase subunit sigma [Planctomycetales bacterium 12-60-4]|nr:MAG: RNA polymerase subunit sigma [Planctomycetales bacterium 12-60-4]